MKIILAGFRSEDWVSNVVSHVLFDNDISLDPLAPGPLSPIGARGELILQPSPPWGEGGGRVQPGEGVFNFKVGQDTRICDSGPEVSRGARAPGS